MIERWIKVEKWPTQALILPRIQAHRGYWQESAQENTLAAFQAAKQKGALMFECDVRLSRDRVPVVFHDEDLRRLGGREDLVRDLTSVELKTYAQVPTLSEVLNDRSVPRFVNIELKSKEKLDDPLERKVANVVKLTRAENRVLFSSFNPMSLYRVSLHLPDVPRALLVTNEEDPDNSWLLRRMFLAPLLSFHCLHLDRRMITADKMRFWQRQKVPVAVWTVNGSENVQKFLRMGAISVISDRWF